MRKMKRCRSIQKPMILQRMQPVKYYEGDNILFTQPQYSVIAKAKGGEVIELVAKEKNGKEYPLQSVTRQPENQSKNSKKKVVVRTPVCIYCFHLLLLWMDLF
jgi:hypothetical protein